MFLYFKSNVLENAEEWYEDGLSTSAKFYDENNDKEITVLELFKYVYSDVYSRTKNNEQPQHPQLIGPKSNFDAVLTKW